MIKLMRPDKPKELEKNETSLTEEYKKTGKSVWRKDYIVKALMEMSHNKCCYCETSYGVHWWMDSKICLNTAGIPITAFPC